MTGIPKKIIDQLTENPKKLFLIDSLGAFLTAFLLFVVLRNFNGYIGIPKKVLTGLSITALTFCLYSTSCLLFLKTNWTSFIRLICMANLLYCIATTGFLLAYRPTLTGIGVGYFLMEMILICYLVYIELNVAKSLKLQTEKDN